MPLALLPVLEEGLLHRQAVQESVQESVQKSASEYQNPLCLLR